MQRTRTVTGLLALVGAATLSIGPAALAGGDEFVETFTNGSNEGGWRFNSPTQVLESQGGNPGWHIVGFCDRELDCLDFFAVILRTTEPSDHFTGDLAARGVTGMGLDARLYYVGNTAEGRPMSICLVDDNGTPDDLGDDCFVYSVGDQNIPRVKDGWVSYDFDVPAQSDTLPRGWTVWRECPNEDPDAAWRRIVRDVDYVMFYWTDPDTFAILQMWEPGADNIRVTTAGDDCVADFDGSGEVDGADFLAFLSAFFSQDPRADIDQSGSIDGADFLAYLSAFFAGC